MRAPRHPNHRDPATLPIELRRPGVPPAVLAWVERQVGRRVVGARRLPGASSAAVHRLYVEGGPRLVLRRYVWPGFLEDEPIAPRREVEALRFALGHGLPVPEVVAADVTGEEVGDGVPVLLMTLVAGRAVAVPDLTRLAEMAARIHAIDARGFEHRYFPWYLDAWSRPPDGARRPRLWERAIELRATAAPEYVPAFVHRDFHPGNVLWVRGGCSGVVDWANACRGPWGCDVAHCRSNLIDLSGFAAADRFTAAYESVTGETYLPFWEVASVLEDGPSPWTPQRLRQSETRLARALGAMTEG